MNKKIFKIITSLSMIFVLSLLLVAAAYADVPKLQDLSAADIVFNSPDAPENSDRVVLSEQNVVVKFRDGLDLSGYKFRLQEKLGTGDWVPLTDYSTEFPTYTFKGEGLVNLHIDIINSLDSKEHKGIWLGEFNVLDKSKALAKPLTISNVVLKAENPKKLEDNNAFLNQTITVKVDDSVSTKDLSFRLQRKTGEGDWEILGEYQDQFPKYTFTEEGQINLHIDIINKSNSLDYKGIWLGEFNVKKMSFAQKITFLVTSNLLISVFAVVLMLIGIFFYTRKRKNLSKANNA